MLKPTVATLVLLGACALDATDESTDLAELRDRGPVFVQPGLNIQLLEVTSDNHALYQLGQQVFATALRPGATAELVAEVPAGNTAFVYQDGKVAFVWTNPDRSVPGFGISPLVIWSADAGAHLASTASSIGTLANSASTDGDQVLFTSNASADGTTGDLELASTDLSHRRTIAAGIPMAFPSGPCVPRAAFLDHGRTLVAATCAPGTLTASLAIWRGDHRTSFDQPLATPPQLWIDRDRARALTTDASRQPVIVGRSGSVEVVSDIPASRVFFAGDGAPMFFGQPDPAAPRELFHRRRGEEPRSVAAPLGIFFFGGGSTGFSSPATSADGRYITYFDAVDPSTGLAANVLRRDLRGDAPAVELDHSGANVGFGVPFSADSRHALFARLDLVTFSVGPMFEGGPRGTRQFSDDLGWSWDAAHDGTITYNDRTDLTAPNPAEWTADLKSVDLGDRTLAPRVIAETANVTYYASHRGRGVAFTLDHVAEPGLYVAAVR